MISTAPKRILFAPLDWGLGHTTRIIPLIRLVQQLGHTAIVAGNAAQRSYLQGAVDGVIYEELEGYNIRYSASNKWLQVGLLLQIPGILRSIQAENEWLRRYTATHQLHGIIADNRYGLHHPTVPSVLLTHQLRIQTGMGNAADAAVQKMHYSYLNRFQATWVVDAQGPINLAGRLAHTQPLPNHAQYIGLLSRFAGIDVPRTEGTGPLVVLLSGPEPQRTTFANLLLLQLRQSTGEVVFIGGSADAPPPQGLPGNIHYIGRVSGPELAGILASAGQIVCRSGYSTIMDLVAMGKQAVLVPTPGQTEQEYLARYLLEKGYCYSSPQHSFQLSNALAAAAGHAYQFPPAAGLYQQHVGVLSAWLGGL